MVADMGIRRRGMFVGAMIDVPLDHRMMFVVLSVPFGRLLLGFEVASQADAYEKAEPCT
jgi:hypothetical protein